MGVAVWRPEAQNLEVSGQKQIQKAEHKRDSLPGHLSYGALAGRPGLVRVPQRVHGDVGHLPRDLLVFDIRKMVEYEKQSHQVAARAGAS